MVTKRYSRPDNVFGSMAIQDFVDTCDVLSHLRPPCTDHFPIATTITLPQNRVSDNPSYNFREVDWDSFRQTLDTLPPPETISTEAQLIQVTDGLMNALVSTMEDCVKRSKPGPDSKRWWNRDLQKMRKRLNRLRSDSYRFRAVTDDPVHRAYKDASNKYGEAILLAKRSHWANYLEEMSANDIWTVNKYLREPVGDGGCPRIPTLKVVDANGNETKVSDNKEKACLFVKTFFPPPPPSSSVPEGYEYPVPLPDPPQLTEERIENQIRKLSPYKAPGPRGVPNVVLQRCSDMLVPRLLHIYRAILKLRVYYDPWREFTTVVLRKPGKPRYDIAKAHRPIALLSTVAKVLTALVADDISRLVELHQLLPPTHFGGRPGRTTTDAISYLVQRIKKAWRGSQVASVLFLDVEGAFPNAVTDRLIHNLRKRRIPGVYVEFIKQLLSGQRTRLKFDDYLSEPMDITNGIGQGDPLSMILYIIYNADLLEITEDDVKEGSLGFVDDIALLAIGQDFEETTERLQRMMNKEDGGLQWSAEHNSNFEVSKSVVMHLTRKTQPNPEDEERRVPLDWPALSLRGQVVQVVQSFKYLGIQIDSQLRWKEQESRTAEKATKWILQYRRLTRPSTGIGSKLMRQLYLSVALPKITYGLEVWFTPPHRRSGAAKNSGSVSALSALQKAQRIAALAITGALRSTPNDLLDAHAGILPIELALDKVCHGALARLLSLPDSHPLYRVVKDARRSKPARHSGPVDCLLDVFKIGKKRYETITPVKALQAYRRSFKVTIAQSRQESINAEKKDKADFRIYTDGSGLRGKIGAAAVLYRRGQVTPVDSIKMSLGKSTEHNNYEGEAAGVNLATWLTECHPETAHKNVSVYVDSKSVLQAMAEPKATSGQQLIREATMSANSTMARLELIWISGHSGVPGNEKADKLAKEAASGRVDGKERLPPTLRMRVPVSISATKQEHFERIKKQWAEIWSESPRRGRFEVVDDNFPFDAFRRRQYNLKRGHASLLVQVRTGHIPLNQYLHRIRKSDTKLCQSCQVVPGEERPVESVNHFLFECNKYADLRQTLARRIGQDNLNMYDVMQDIKKMKLLANFIVKTDRLKDAR
jgi:ribonuclease HI